MPAQRSLHLPLPARAGGGRSQFDAAELHGPGAGAPGIEPGLPGALVQARSTRDFGQGQQPGQPALVPHPERTELREAAVGGAPLGGRLGVVGVGVGEAQRVVDRADQGA